MIPITTAIIVAMIAGLVHQLVDFKTSNTGVEKILEKKEIFNWVFSVVIAGVVAYLYWAMAKNGSLDIGLWGREITEVGYFLLGYFGHSIFMNLITRKKKELLKPELLGVEE